ncbi:MAG: superoxide dismutase [Syntrophales bacterium]|nr:superoxide dismutase [Syntrophales bacterium]
MTIERGSLPYEPGALEPTISARTVNFHYGKHHATYETNANKLLEGTGLEGESMEAIIKKTVNDSARTGVFNNVAQVWNHTFYWKCLKPNGGGEPGGKVLELITSSFGGYEQFKEKFHAAAMARFGSGWAWLVMREGSLEIMTTANADTPVAQGIKTLLTVDVWEHAYYLDYQNRRADYLTAVMDNLINWDFVNELLAK